MLLVSGEPATVQQTSEVIEQYALHAEVCSNIPTALGLLNRRKFEAAIVDVGSETGDVLEQIRLSPSNRTVVIFAITNNDAEASEALQCGASFVIRRPFSPAVIHSTLRAAYGSIVQERRRYFRCPVELPALIQESGREEIPGTVVNVSAGGLGIAASQPLRVGAKVRIGFNLPGGPSPLLVEATICWAREHYVGLQFVSLAAQSRSDLEEWLSRKLEESLPEGVADQFRNPGNLKD